jgi:hypothetical protein
MKCQFVTTSSSVNATGGDDKAVQEKPNSMVTVRAGEGEMDSTTVYYATPFNICTVLSRTP